MTSSDISESSNKQDSNDSVDGSSMPSIDDQSAEPNQEVESLLHQQIEEFKKRITKDVFNCFSLNLHNYVKCEDENYFSTFKRQLNLPPCITEFYNTNKTEKSKLIEMKQIFLSHNYKTIPKSFSVDYFYSQVTCYIKNQNHTLAHFQGISIANIKGQDILTVLIERPVNGPLSSLFSTVKSNESEKATKDKIYRSNSFNINDLTTVTAEQKFIIIVGIIHGIAFIHNNKFIHSNLNPTTIYLNEKLQPIICDYIFIPPFKITIKNNGDDDNDDYEYTFKYSIDPKEPTFKFDNEKYVAPEILDGKEFSKAVDIYSLGYIIEYILREGEKEKEAEEDNKIGDKWNKLINKCINREPNERPTALSILLELLKEENIKEYISEITPNSSAQEISEKTKILLKIYRIDAEEELMNSNNSNNNRNNTKSNLEIFHLMIPNINDLDEYTKLIISAAEKDDIESISKVGDWFFNGENNFYKDYEWSYKCYKKAADKVYEIFKSKTEPNQKAEKKDLYPLLQLAEFNKNGIGTDINLNLSYEYYEKALEILKEDDPGRSAIEEEKNNMYELKNRIIMKNIPKNYSPEIIERYFKRCKIEGKSINQEVNGEIQQMTIQFKDSTNMENAIKKIKDSSQFSYERLNYIKKKKSAT